MMKPALRRISFVYELRGIYPRAVNAIEGYVP